MLIHGPLGTAGHHWYRFLNRENSFINREYWDGLAG